MNTKQRRTILVLLALAAFLPFWHPPVRAAEIYRIDPDHSAVTFRVKHLGITFVYGRFSDPEGTFAFTDASPADCFIDIQVRAENIDTGNAKRDRHLRSPDFFDVETFPLILFKSVHVSKLPESAYEVLGNLTLHGITRSVLVEATQTGAVQLPDGEVRTGFETTFTIFRSDYGMRTMLGGVADQVELTVSVEGVRQP